MCCAQELRRERRFHQLFQGAYVNSPFFKLFICRLKRWQIPQLFVIGEDSTDPPGGGMTGEGSPLLVRHVKAQYDAEDGKATETSGSEVPQAEEEVPQAAEEVRARAGDNTGAENCRSDLRCSVHFERCDCEACANDARRIREASLIAATQYLAAIRIVAPKHRVEGFKASDVIAASLDFLAPRPGGQCE